MEKSIRTLQWFKHFEVPLGRLPVWPGSPLLKRERRRLVRPIHDRIIRRLLLKVDFRQKGNLFDRSPF